MTARAGRGDESPQRRQAGTVDAVGRGRGGPPPRGSATKRAVAPDPYRYTMTDLEEQTGFNARTIRYYISQGLLPPAHGRGPGATYDLGHLLRLQAIQLLKANFLPLDEIKRRLGDLTNEDIAALLQVETAPPEDRWRRIQLHPDIELHVRERGGRGHDPVLAKVVDTIVRHATVAIDDLEGAP